MVKFIAGTAAEVAASVKTGNAGDLVTETDTGNLSIADGATTLGDLKRLTRVDEVPLLDEDGKVPEAHVPDRLSESGLSASTAVAIEPTRKRTATIKPRIVTLISGQVDQTPTSVSSCTTSADTTHYKIGSQGLKVTIPAASSPWVNFDPVMANADPLVFPPASQVYMWLYVPDHTKITGLDVEIYGSADSATDHRWTRSLSHTLTGTLVDGWNLLRWKASAGTVTGWGSAYRVRVVFQASAATNVTIGHLWVECPAKAQIVFIEDRGYKTFKDNGLPDLRALGVPVVWALDPALNGSSPGTKNEAITDDDVADFYAAGDEINIHSYDGSVTSAMTSDQLVTDWMLAARWLQQHGYPVPLFRAAFTQNLAAAHAALQGFMLGYATPTATSGHESWPPRDRYNIGRYGIHGRSDATIDAQFDLLQATNGLWVVYTHGIHTDGTTNGGADMTPAGWAHFITKLAAALDDGWLEAVTFEELFARSGGRFAQGLGSSRAEFTDPNGDLILQELM